MARVGRDSGEGLRRVTAAHIGRRAIRWLPVLLWMAAIFYVSAQPDLPHHPEATMDLIIKKLGHMLEYGILAVLALWALRGGGRVTTARNLICALAIAGLYAISDEMHQHFVPGRNARTLDVGFDLLGALLALLAVVRLVGATAGLPRR